MEKKCFVIQRFDAGRYDDLYEQVFRPAIEKAGFVSYRVDQDPRAAIPIESIEREISSADACFAELSEDAPNVWFEVGYSIARQKPLCLVCSSARTKFPFDVQHRQIIKYPEQALPRDYVLFAEKITERLKSILQTDIAERQNASAADALSIVPELNGLKPHELLALTFVFQSQFGEASQGWSIKNSMERAGYAAVAAGLAIAGLRRKGLIKSVELENDYGNRFMAYEVTQSGEDWLMDHEDEFNLKLGRYKKQVVDYGDTGIRDEDIPF